LFFLQLVMRWLINNDQLEAADGEEDAGPGGNDHPRSSAADELPDGGLIGEPGGRIIRANRPRKVTGHEPAHPLRSAITDWRENEDCSGRRVTADLFDNSGRLRERASHKSNPDARQTDWFFGNSLILLRNRSRGQA
jgi:hypothetical protein